MIQKYYLIYFAGFGITTWMFILMLFSIFLAGLSIGWLGHILYGVHTQMFEYLGETKL